MVDQLIASKIMDVEGAIPSYSTDAAAAFSVLEALHKKGWFWRLDSLHDGVECVIQGVPTGAKSLKERLTYAVRAPSVAQAIAECAVKTIENPK